MKVIQQFAEDMPILYTAIKIILILVVTRVLVEVLKAILKKVEKAGLNKLKKPNKIGYRLLKNVLVTALYILGGVTAVKQVPALSTAGATHYQRNANQNHYEVPFHASQNGCHPKVYKQ